MWGTAVWKRSLTLIRPFASVSIAQAVEAEVLCVPQAAAREQQRLGRQLDAVRQEDAHVAACLLDPGSRGVEPQVKAGLGEARLEQRRYLIVEEGQQRLVAVDQRHLDAQRLKQRRVLAADDAATNDDQRLRQAAQAQDAVAVEDALAEGHLRRAHGPRARRDQDVVGG